MAKKSTKKSNTPKNGREQALEVALADLKKRFGDGAVMKLGDAHNMLVEASSSGCLSLPN